MKKKNFKSLALLGVFLQGVASSGVAVAKNSAGLLKEHTSIKGSSTAGAPKSKSDGAEKDKTVFVEGKNKSKNKDLKDGAKGIGIPNNATTVSIVAPSAAVVAGAGVAGVKKLVDHFRNGTKIGRAHV